MEDRLQRYFQYIQQYPFLFKNEQDNKSITVILNADEIIQAQEELYKNALLKNLPLNFFDLGVICEDEWYVGLRDLVIFPDGAKVPYVRFINKKGNLQNAYNCAILPYDNQKIYFQREYKHDVRGWRWLTPRGFGEKGLNAEENAKKELFEETGYRAESFYLISKPTEPDIFLFLAKVDSSQMPQHNDRLEAISDSVWLDLKELARWINEGLIIDEYSLRFYVYLLQQGFPTVI